MMTYLLVLTLMVAIATQAWSADASVPIESLSKEQQAQLEQEITEEVEPKIEAATEVVSELFKDQSALPATDDQAREVRSDGKKRDWSVTYNSGKRDAEKARKRDWSVTYTSGKRDADAKRDWSVTYSSGKRAEDNSKRADDKRDWSVTYTSGKRAAEKKRDWSVTYTSGKRDAEKRGFTFSGKLTKAEESEVQSTLSKIQEALGSLSSLAKSNVKDN